MIELLSDMNILYDSFQLCKKSVSWKSSVQRFEANLLLNLRNISRVIEDGKYKQKPFSQFNINERGKQRHIKALHISDRVLQRALCDYILVPLLYKYLIYDNGASVKGKGVEFTRNRLVTHLQKYYRKHGNIGYILTIDFSKFFDSIPHNTLIDNLEKKIKDEKVMDLIKSLIAEFDKSENPKSLGIGSQISQICGIFYPTPIDNYCKIVKQCKYYGRYMDDLYVIHEDKEFLKQLLKEITEIAEQLGLTINTKKTQISRTDKGFTFLKLRTFITETGKIVRKPAKCNIVRERRKLKKLKRKCNVRKLDFLTIYDSYKSWRGGLKRYDSFHAIENMDNLFNSLYETELIMYDKQPFGIQYKN